MATVVIPNTFVTGTTILASEMNANFNAITAQVNGNLDANNLANSAVTENKIANLAVTEGKLASSAVATAKIANLAVTEAKLAASAVTASKLAADAVTNVKIAAAAAIDAAKIADGSVSNTEFQYLNGVTSAIQTQIDAKEDAISVTANRAIASDASGNLVASAVTDTELGYLDGVTSAIQTQLDGKVPTSRSITAGTGLSGGGTLASNRTISHAAHTGDVTGATALTIAAGAVTPSKTSFIDDLTKIYVGRVSSSGTSINLPTGWSVIRIATGNYHITHNLGHTNYGVIVTPNSPNPAGFFGLPSSTVIDLEFRYNDGTTINTEFSFIVFTD